jgi:type IV secretion system protein VirB6
MGPDLFQGIFGLIDTTLGTYIIDTATNIINFVKPIFQNLMIIWIAIWGYLAMMGHTNEPLKEGVYRILRLGFILALGLTLGTYLGVTVNFLSKGPEQIAAAVTGSPPASIGVTLDNLYIKVFEITDACFENGGILDGNVGMYLMGFAFMILGTALLLAVAVFLISAKIMTAVLLGIGPVFIALLLFKGTQRFFESWLGMVCNYGMILILTVGLGAVALKLANAFIVKMGFPDGAWGNAATAYAHGMANIDGILKLLVVFGITVLLMLQVPNVASALGGGIALGTAAVVSRTMAAMSPGGAMRAGDTLRRGARNFKGEKRAINRGMQSFRKTFGRGNSIGAG